MDKGGKKTPTIHPLLHERWSPRAFSSKAVEEQDLWLLFEAARWAPSSFNEQPWAFIVACESDREVYEQMANCLSERNRQWATTAPVLAVCLAKTHFEHNKKENRHSFYDTGLAVANLVMQATDLGISVHQMAGFSTEKVREKFLVPPAFEPVAAMAIGYAGNPARLPSDLRMNKRAARRRKALREFVFGAEWGKPYEFNILTEEENRNES
ncbi:MAG: nitroreductase family protein [Calditrichia bacterium]